MNEETKKVGEFSSDQTKEAMKYYKRLIMILLVAFSLLFLNFINNESILFQDTYGPYPPEVYLFISNRLIFIGAICVILILISNSVRKYFIYKKKLQ